MAGLHDPMVAVSSSAVDPLPHQIKAVYGELLPRTPLRFLLADDPGAGKTIMAGLYAKELMLRGNLTRMLIISPGGLVEQWQDELATKFGINAELLSREMITGQVDSNPFNRYPILIARMDQLARNDDLLALLDASDWDLIVVDEAHRMSANYRDRPQLPDAERLTSRRQPVSPSSTIRCWTGSPDGLRWAPRQPVTPEQAQHAVLHRIAGDPGVITGVDEQGGHWPASFPVPRRRGCGGWGGEI
jgi:hypothetical protein